MFAVSRRTPFHPHVTGHTFPIRCTMGLGGVRSQRHALPPWNFPLTHLPNISFVLFGEEQREQMEHQRSAPITSSTPNRTKQGKRGSDNGSPKQEPGNSTPPPPSLFSSSHFPGMGSFRHTLFLLRAPIPVIRPPHHAAPSFRP